MVEVCLRWTLQPNHMASIKKIQGMFDVLLGKPCALFIQHHNVDAHLYPLSPLFALPRKEGYCA